MMVAKLIQTVDEYEGVLARIDVLMDAKRGTPEADELELLATLAEVYEERVCPVGLPDPIAAIRFRMEQQGLKQKDLIPFLGSASRVSEVLHGKRPLTLKMIRALHEGLGIPAEVLLQEPGASVPIQVEGIEKFPLAEMRKRGWFEGFSGTAAQAKDQAEELIGAFLAPLSRMGVQPALCRQHVRAGSEMDQYALLAWRARVLTVAQSLDVGKYSPGTITPEFMDQLIHLSYLDRSPVLAREFLAKAGIRLVVESHLSKTYLDGAAMIGLSGSPVVALTSRYDRLDNFWFTLCHELGHVALHLAQDAEDCYLDDMEAEAESQQERDADRFAQDSLIPPEAWQTSAVRRSGSIRDLLAFARSLRINPAIVAGRLQWQRNDYSKYRKLLGRGQVGGLLMS